MLPVLSCPFTIVAGLLHVVLLGLDGGFVFLAWFRVSVSLAVHSYRYVTPVVLLGVYVYACMSLHLLVRVSVCCWT